MKDEKRFIKVEKYGSEWNTYFEVFVDRETGVNYLFVKSGYGAGLTPLLDEEGKPVVTHGIAY